MPIPVAKLREMQRPLADRIFEFLSKHPGNAYSHIEIVEHLLGMTSSEIAALDAARAEEIGRSLRDAIKALVDAGKVKTVMHNELVYVHAARRLHATIRARKR